MLETSLELMNRADFAATVFEYELELARSSGDIEGVISHTNELLDEVINDPNQPSLLRYNARYYRYEAPRIEYRHISA